MTDSLDVYHAGQRIGTLTRAGGDLPWHVGTFAPTAVFDAVRPLFDRERNLLAADRMDEWAAAWTAIADGGLRLVATDGSLDTFECIVHIDCEAACGGHDPPAYVVHAAFRLTGG